jgi:hypothetical protein
MLPFGVTIQATVPQRSEIPKGLMNCPVDFSAYILEVLLLKGIDMIRERINIYKR